MDLGFETIGNATIIAHDKAPVIATDPWVSDWAYFGSWILSHEIPEEQLKAVDACPYIWFSHGHPDHLNLNCLGRFKNKTILLPDHVGSRIKNDLLEQGFKVQVLESRKWYPLSDRIQVLCIADFNQDGILLLNIGGKLVVNLNDAGNNGGFSFVKKVIKKFETSYLLALTGYGDANMINYFDEDGKFILPQAALKKPVGKDIQNLVEEFGTTHFIPSSSLHQYQRSDSVWANQFITPVEAYNNGFDSQKAKLLPAFVQVDCNTGKYKEINPREVPSRIVDSKEFGDNWSDQLTGEDLALLEKYFRAPAFLQNYLDFIHLRVGGKDHHITFNKSKFNRGVTFETPRFSLVEAAKYEIFDDLLIGNYMKTTLRGKWPESKLFPSFDGHLTKYSDNGKAKSKDEVRSYMMAYVKVAPAAMIAHFAAEKGKSVFRKVSSPDSQMFKVAKMAYKKIK